MRGGGGGGGCHAFDTTSSTQHFKTRVVIRHEKEHRNDEKGTGGKRDASMKHSQHVKPTWWEGGGGVRRNMHSSK